MLVCSTSSQSLFLVARHVRRALARGTRLKVGGKQALASAPGFGAGAARTPMHGVKPGDPCHTAWVVLLGMCPGHRCDAPDSVPTAGYLPTELGSTPATCLGEQRALPH